MSDISDPKEKPVDNKKKPDVAAKPNPHAAAFQWPEQKNYIEFAPVEKKQPHAVAMTNPKADTFHKVTTTPGDGMLMYWPEQNSFLALYPDEFHEIHAEADEHSKKIAMLQAANQKVTQLAVALRAAQKSGVQANMKKAARELEEAINELGKASEEVKKKIEPLGKLDAKGSVKMVEMVSLKTREGKGKGVPIYVKSTSLKKILADKRVYLVEGEKQKRAKEKILDGYKLNTNEIKHRMAAKVQDSAKFKKEWKLKPDDADAYSGVLTQWAKTMNGDIAKFIERNHDDVEKKFNINKDSHRNIDLSADAQLMRYTGGAGLEVNFKPFFGNLFDKRDHSLADRLKRGSKSGDLSIKANAEASFAIAEGRIRTELYWPHYAGWHATAVVAEQTIEFGYWRFYGDIILSGNVGASLAIECEIGVSYTGGKQGIRGIPAANKNKSGVKARAGASAELNAFAGARAGLDAKGALQWLNPEGAASKGKPYKVKPGSVVAEYKDMAKVDAGVAGTAGAGVYGAFKVRHEEGNFVIYAKLGACLGLGGDATLKFAAGVDTIGEFFKFMAYQLKRADWHKIAEAFDKEAYVIYCKIKYMLIAKSRELTDFVGMSVDAIDKIYDEIVKKINLGIQQGTDEALKFLQRVRLELEKQTGGWFSYAAPEVAGQILRQVASLGLSEHSELQQQASAVMALSLGSPQTLNQLATIAERMTPIMGDKQSDSAGYALITASLANGAHSDSLRAAQQRLANVGTLNSTPFIWNTDPEFAFAKLGIEHPMFA
jgi:hypothetical protein